MVLLRWRDPFERSAFSELNKLQDEMNMLFERFLGRHPLAPSSGVFPPINVTEDDDNIYLTAELPGVAPDKIDITVEDESVTIKGERKTEPEGGGEVSYHRKERAEGEFSRTITLPTRIQADKATAEAKDGILTLVLPKAEEVKPKKIEIKAG